MKIGSVKIYRAVGFTTSSYMNGSREVGWTGEFFPTREEAEEAGCGVSAAWHNGEEVREYTLEDHGDYWEVFVDGETGSDDLHKEVVDAAIELRLATQDGLLENA